MRHQGLVYKMPERTGPKGGLGLECLESRLNMSSMGMAAVPAAHAASSVQDVSTARKYRIESYTLAQTAPTYGQSWVNKEFTAAQQFFNKFKEHFALPNPTPPPAPVSPTPDPTPPPTPPPPAPPGLPPVTLAQSTRGNLTRLTITGTTGNDSIVVTQSGGTLTINANGHTDSVSGNFGELAVYGGAGDDTITVQSSVSVSTLVYGGSGNNTLIASANAKNYIVALGAGNDVLTGNGINTSFWADSADIVNASSGEIANGNVHKVASFYQPFSTDAGSADYVPLSLDGQDLRDPTDSGATIRLGNSLWGTGPVMTDINQGSVGDCYYLASLQSLAYKQPGKLQEMAVDLGDGTYAVQFKRGGTSTYVRVDGDLPSGWWNGLMYAHPTSGGGIWAEIMEKAYAYYRTGSNSYNSLSSGWTGAALSDLGIMTTTFNTSVSGPSLFNTLTTALANAKPVAAITVTTIASGTPIIGSHAYTVVSTSVESGVQYVTVRNPWGTDGSGNDGNPYDGIVKITLAQFQASFSAGSIMV